VDLEVQVAAGADGVAGFADAADPLPLPDPLAPTDVRRTRHVGVEVGAALAFAVDQEIVAVEDRVITGTQDPAVAHRDQLGAAGGHDVEPFVDAPTVARRVVLADRATFAVRSLDREDMAVVGDAALAAGDASRGRSDQDEEEDESEKGVALQWCAMTRSTMLYSTASSALMK
jgi:hypothetical protein